jgi:hypothetical protein
LTDFLLILAMLMAFLPASTLLAKGPAVYLISPIVSVVSALAATFAHTLFDIGVMTGWSALVALQIVILAFPAGRSALKANLKVSKGDHWGIAALSITGLLSLGAVVSTPAPLAWDARSIWFHHALWLNGPALYFREAQFLPVGNWPDYPFTGPGLMTLIWQITGGEPDLWLASSVVGVVVICVAALTVFLLSDKFAPEGHWSIKASALVVFVSSITFLADGYYNAGYQDAFQAAAVGLVFVSVMVLQKQDGWSRLALPALAFLLAANIKQEGFWFAFGALVLALALQLLQRNWNSLVLIPFALLARAGWSAFQESLGMPDNGHTSEVVQRIPALFAGDSEIIANLGMIFNLGVGPRSSGYLFVIAAAAILIAVFYRPVSISVRVSTSLVVLAAPAGVLSVAALTYALGQSGGLEWWLGTSYSRITATFELLSLLAMLIAVLVAMPEAKRVVVAQRPKNNNKSKKTRR